jgi:hypothetical protein
MDHGRHAAAEDGPGQSMNHTKKGRHRTRGRRPRSRSAASLPPVDDDSSARLPSHQSAVVKNAGSAARPVCVLERARDLTLVENNLRHCALFVVVIGSRPPVTAELLAAEIAAEYELDPASFSVHRSVPEDFVIIMQNEQAVLRVFNNGAVLNSPSGSFKFIKWSRLAHAEAVSLPSFVSVSFEGVPLHAWSVETARSLLRAHCTALELHPDTVARLNFSSFRVLGWSRHPELIPVAVDLLILKPVQSFEVETTVKHLLAYQVMASVSLISPSAGDVSPPPSPPASNDDRDTRSRRRRLQQASPARQGGPVEALAVRRPVHERLGPLPICPRHVAISQEVLEQEVSKEASLNGSSNLEEHIPAVKELNIGAMIEASEDNVESNGRRHEQACMVEAGASGLSGGCPSHSPLPVPSSPSSPLRAPAVCCSMGGCEKEQAIQVLPPGSPSRATFDMGGQKSALVDARTSSRLSRRSPIITYFRQRRKKDSQPSLLLGASPSPPSGAKEFIDKLTRPAGGILRAPVRRPRQGKATATEVVPRHNRRVAGAGVERLATPPPATQGKKHILKELGIVNAEETVTIRPKDLDEYARVFSKGLSEVQVTAMAALFDWSRPMELLQGGPIC